MKFYHPSHPLYKLFNRELTNKQKELMKKANEIVEKYVKLYPPKHNNIMTDYKIETLLWLDDKRDPSEQQWLNWLAQYSPIEQPYEIIWVKSYDQFVDWIKKNSLPDGVCYDHDLGRDIADEKVAKGMSKRQARKERQNTKSGMDCAKWLVEYCLDNNVKMPNFSIQSANPSGKENIDGLLKGFIKHQQQ